MNRQKVEAVKLNVGELYGGELRLSRPWIPLSPINTYIRSIRIGLEIDQCRPAVDELAGLEIDVADNAGVRSRDGMFHLHRFQHDQRLARRNRLPLLDQQFDDCATHRRLEARLSGARSTAERQ